jgi:hypothetical protein
MSSINAHKSDDDEKETIIEMDKSDIIEDKPLTKIEKNEGSMLKLVFWILVGCSSSVVMTLFNKKIIMAFP